ncbi:hypothetical protein, partial [Enterobacter kobei]|uniref:hypothetical protein n=1 Tax=Enterobacter kobei TaxID=208224 RepID=UPI001C40053C
HIYSIDVIISQTIAVIGNEFANFMTLIVFLFHNHHNGYAGTINFVSSIVTRPPEACFAKQHHGKLT